MSDESVILINLLKVKPEKRDALIALLAGCTDRALEAEPRHGDPHAARVEDDPADRGEGRRRPQASAFHLAGRASSSKTPAGAIPSPTNSVGNGTIADVRRFWLAFGNERRQHANAKGRSQSPSTALRAGIAAHWRRRLGEWRTLAHSRPE